MSVPLYRSATRDELSTAMSWAQQEGWNPGRGDADLYWHSDHVELVCMEIYGELAGMGGLVSYGGAFGFMGFYILRPDLRGQGLGGPFWRWRKKTLEERLHPGATIGMDGITHMEDFYARGGFVTAHGTHRVEGIGVPSVPSSSVVDLRDVTADELQAYDQKCFGFSRGNFIHKWINRPGVRALGFEKRGRLTGMGVIRPAHTGYRIGPLFADTPEQAEELFLGLQDAAAGQPYSLDLPDANPHAIALAETYDLHQVFRCARMYCGSPFQQPLHRIYGGTSLELG